MSIVNPSLSPTPTPVGFTIHTGLDNVCGFGGPKFPCEARVSHQLKQTVKRAVQSEKIMVYWFQNLFRTLQFLV